MCDNKEIFTFFLRRVAMAEWLARQTPNHKIVGSSPA